jgi:hypothetical protein
MFNNVLVLTVMIILVVAMIGAIMRVRRKDACLKSFSGYMVYVRMKSGKQVWGTLRVESTGLELKYRADHNDTDGHIESSYIIFKPEFPNIFLLLRFFDEVTPRNAARRDKQLRRSYHPKLFRRIRRKVKIWFNLMRDALAEALSAALSSATKTSPVAGQQSRMSKAGSEMIEWFGNAYDPILEHHIGRKVVVEVTAPDGAIIEYVGVFREYSPDYLEVIDVPFREGDKIRRVDLLVPRTLGLIRHDGENVPIKKQKDGHPAQPAPVLLDDVSEPETFTEPTEGASMTTESPTPPGS